nr:protein-disulfide reductase DsbD domain-containing protein [Vibrio sinensis]
MATLILLSGITSLLSGPAYAQSTGWITDPTHPPVQLRFMSTGEHNFSNKTVQAVLDIELDGDWKTYWRSPGEGGIAPDLDWSASDNIENVEWHWPIPGYYDQLGVTTLGYKSHVSFPITLTLTDISQPAVFEARLRLPSCTNICVITDYQIKLPIDPKTLYIDQQALFLFNQGMSQSPRDSSNLKLDGLYWDAAKQQLVAKITNRISWETPQLLVDGSQVEDEFFAKPHLYFDKDSQHKTLTAVFDVTNWAGNVDLENKSVSLTISDQTFATELVAPIGNTPISYSDNTMSFFLMVGFALLGGLILNIMPCVLPVLGMKLNSILMFNQISPNTPPGSVKEIAFKREVRTSFVASALGIIASFMLLAFTLSVLKLGGHAIGWGIQFQNVGFLALMLVVTLTFSANLLGLFEFRLPANLNTWMATKGNHSYAGHFVQGMFATLLATPCSAPFLGTAVAYALGASYQELWGIFLALGVGMSAPWLLFALFPSLVNFMPKPGAWMFKVKMIFGLMMLVTSLWLASLLTPFIGQFATFVLSTTLLLSMIIALGIKFGKRVLIPIIGIMTVVLGAGLIMGSLTADRWATPIIDDLAWQKLQTEKIVPLTEQGKTVFVDVTADWCITCKANKIGVILQDPVYSTLKQDDIVLMKGDWTTPSDEIMQYLQSNGRYGVPFNIVYGPNAPQGIPLSVILSEQQVMQAIDKASQ